MPLNNPLFGIYKTIKVNGKFVLCSEFSRKSTMKVEAKNYIQGTAKNRIMDIGGVSEDIQITAPILIGGAKWIDGRSLLTDQIVNALNPLTTVLPILTNASIKIDAKSGGTVTMSLKSDGNPANPGVVEIRGDDVSALAGGGHTDVLNPHQTGTGNGPTRTSKFFDFRVNLGGYYMYVKSADIAVAVTVSDNYFLGGAAVGHTPTDADQDSVNNWGYQYTTLGVQGITVSGGGTAAILLTDPNSDGTFLENGEHTNADFNSGASPLTLQRPGRVNSVAAQFTMEVYDPNALTGTPQWVDLFSQWNGSAYVPILDLQKSVVSEEDIKVSTGLLTVAFKFHVWVK